MTGIEEVGAIVVDEYAAHADLYSEGGYWRCGCGQALGHDWTGSPPPKVVHESHQHEAVGRFVERIVHEFDRKAFSR